MQKYTAANGAVFDEDVGLYRLTPAQFASLKSLFFIIHGVRTHERDIPHGPRADRMRRRWYSSSPRTRRSGPYVRPGPLFTRDRR